MNNITVFMTRFLVHFSLFFSCIIFLCRVFTHRFYGFKYLYLFCCTLPMQLSSAAHLQVSNSPSPNINFDYLLQMQPCLTLSYLHLPFNLHYSPSKLSHAYHMITQASLFTTIHYVYVAVVCS